MKSSEPVLALGQISLMPEEEYELGLPVTIFTPEYF